MTGKMSTRSMLSCRVWLEHMREWLETLQACRNLRPLVELSTASRPEFAQKGPSLLRVLGPLVSSTDGRLQAAALRCLQVRTADLNMLCGEA